MSIKQTLTAMCFELLEKHPGWSYVNGDFRKKIFKDTTIFVSPGFYNGDSISRGLQPRIIVRHKGIEKLISEIAGEKWLTACIFLNQISRNYRSTPDNPRPMTVYMKEVPIIMNGIRKPWPPTFMMIEDAPAYLEKLFDDGIGFLHQYFDLSSEENLLANIADRGIPGFYDRGRGIVYCLIRIYLGDFDFVETYRRDDFQAIKYEAQLNKIIAALPELKRRYELTGKVI